MVSLLLAMIYLAFIGLGLPDALLGAAWPMAVGELGDDDVIRGTSSNPMGSFDFDAVRGEF